MYQNPYSGFGVYEHTGSPPLRGLGAPTAAESSPTALRDVLSQLLFRHYLGDAASFIVDVTVPLTTWTPPTSVVRALYSVLDALAAKGGTQAQADAMIADMAAWVANALQFDNGVLFPSEMTKQALLALKAKAFAAHKPYAPKYIPKVVTKPGVTHLVVGGRTVQASALRMPANIGTGSRMILAQKSGGSMMQDPGFSIPGLPAGQVPAITYEDKQGLWWVSPTAQPVLRAALQMMSSSAPSSSLPGATQWSASFVVGQLAGNGAGTVDAAIAAGQVVLLDKGSPATGTLQLIATSSADAAYAMACSNCGDSYAAIVGGSPAILAAMAQLGAGGGGVAPGSPCPEGMIRCGGPSSPCVKDYVGACDHPGGGGTKTASAATSTTPAWVIPVVAGVGALAIIALALAASNNKKAA